MSVVFPNNNLPTASQPWGREVQKRLSILLDSNEADSINNAARDNQLNSSIIALTGVVTGVQTATVAAQSAADAAAAAATTANSAATNANNAINGLIGLGSTGSGYTLNVSNITTGGTLRDGVLTLDSGSNSKVAIFNGGVDINGPGAELKVGNAGNGGTLHNGAFTVLGGNIRAPGITATTFLQSEAQTGTGQIAANLTAAGTVVRSGSSRKIKQDISDLVISYNDVLSLQPKRFRLKQEVAENKNARYYAGFIAEEIDETPLKDFVAYDKAPDGTIAPSGVYYAELTTALLQAIKYQDTLIKSLTERITTLENKDKVE